MWDTIFNAANIVAMAAWAVLILLPRRPLTMTILLYCGVGLLCLAYTAGLIGLLTGLVDPGGAAGNGGGFTSIAEVREIFASDGGLTIGWVHYLAFDLFVGLWIARDADAKGFGRIVQAPVLLATFIAGPVGLLVWLCLRERRARATHGRFR